MYQIIYLEGYMQPSEGREYQFLQKFNSDIIINEMGWDLFIYLQK